MQSSPSREDAVLALEVVLQPRRLHVVPRGIGVDGSSESVSCSTGGGAESGIEGVSWGIGTFWAISRLVKALGADGGGIWSCASVKVLGCGFGVSSVVECLPIVHGGIDRNSSNVKTRGLQHLQPDSKRQPEARFVRTPKKGRPDTFLTLVEYWRSGMVYALFLSFSETLAASFVYTLLCHFKTNGIC